MYHFLYEDWEDSAVGYSAVSQNLQVFGKKALGSEVGDRIQFYHHLYIKKAITRGCDGYIESFVCEIDRSQSRYFLLVW